jgi:hypothetical protein
MYSSERWVKFCFLLPSDMYNFKLCILFIYKNFIYLRISVPWAFSAFGNLIFHKIWYLFPFTYFCLLYYFQWATDIWQTVNFMAGPDAGIEETPVCLCLEINPGPSTHNVTLSTELCWLFWCFSTKQMSCGSNWRNGNLTELLIFVIQLIWGTRFIGFRSMSNDSKRKMLMLIVCFVFVCVCIMRCCVRKLRRIFSFSLPSSYYLFPRIILFVTVTLLTL